MMKKYIVYQKYLMQKPKPSQRPIENQGRLTQLIQEAEKEVLELGSQSDEAGRKIKQFSEQSKSKQTEVSKLQKQQKLFLEKQEKMARYETELSSLQQAAEKIDGQQQEKTTEINDLGFKLRLIDSEQASIKAKESEVRRLLQAAKKDVSKKDFIEKDNQMTGPSRQKLSNLIGQWAELQVDNLNEELGQISKTIKQLQATLKQEKQMMEKLQRQLSKIQSNAAANSTTIKKIRTEMKAISTKGPSPNLKLLYAKREAERIQLEIDALNEQRHGWDSSRLRYQNLIALLKSKIEIIQKKPQNNSLELGSVQDELEEYITEVFNINKRLASPRSTANVTPQGKIGLGNVKLASGSTFEKSKNK